MHLQKKLVVFGNLFIKKILYKFIIGKMILIMQNLNINHGIEMEKDTTFEIFKPTTNCTIKITHVYLLEGDRKERVF